MKSIILSLIALFICSTSAVQFNRTCRFDEMRPRVKMNLNIRDYTGLWFEIKRYEAQDQFDMDCVTASYTEFNNGVNVTNVGWASDGRRISFDGRATVSAEGAATNRAMLEVSFFPGQPPAPYWVMSTNYFDYAVVWSCFNIGEDRSNETFWVLSRNIVPSANTTARFNEVLTQNGALFEELRITNHDMDFCMRNKTVAAI